jgi:hypothetical protein
VIVVFPPWSTEYPKPDWFDESPESTAGLLANQIWELMDGMYRTSGSVVLVLDGAFAASTVYVDLEADLLARGVRVIRPEVRDRRAAVTSSPDESAWFSANGWQLVTADSSENLGEWLDGELLGWLLKPDSVV